MVCLKHFFFFFFSVEDDGKVLGYISHISMKCIVACVQQRRKKKKRRKGALHVCLHKPGRMAAMGCQHDLDGVLLTSAKEKER